MPKQTKTASGRASTKKKTASSGSAKKTNTAAKKRTTSKAAARPAKPPQRRELWVLSCFFLTILFTLSSFAHEGILISGLRSLTLGLLGWGAYLLAAAAFADCIVILLARGKPVGARLWAISLIPLFASVLIHLFLCTDTYTWKNFYKLYTAGQYLISGGLLGGGIAELFAAVFSHAGAVILTMVLLIADVLVIWKVRLRDIADFITELRDAGEARRKNPRYDDYEEYEDYPDEPGYVIKKSPDPIPEEVREVQRIERRREERERAEQERLLAQEERERAEKERAREEERAAREDEKKSRLRRSRTPDLPLEPIEPGRQAHPVYSRISDDPEPLSEISQAAPEEAEFAREPETVHVPSEPPAYALERWAKAPVPEEEEPESSVRVIEAPQPMREYEPMEDAGEPEDELGDTQEPAPPITAQDESSGEESPAPEELPGDVGESASPESHREVTQDAGELPEAHEEDHAPWDEPAAAAGDVTVVDTHMAREETRAAAVTGVQESAAEYEFPPVSFLREDKSAPTEDATEELRMRSQILTDTLQSFGVQAHISGVVRGPSVTRYELQLERGVKLQRLTALQNDIALALGATGVRIAPIPDKVAVGIEVPNKVVQFVYLRDVLLSQNMSTHKSKIAFALGRDITGDAIVADIRKMPHLLIAGTTGSGKSVCINSIIVSLLYRATPKEVRFIMIDPKMVELGNYNGIPHLLIPVVTDYKKAPGTLAWAVSEMERRYKLMAAAGVRDLASYNRAQEAKGEEKLPSIVIIIDELADLMMVAAKEIEEAICRIAQKARAAGMHLIIATQRPSADVLTGLMKSNIPSRIAFAVASQVESRIILDQGGAEKLIGRGDMLFLPIGAGKPLRVQGCFLSDEEIEQITEFIKAHSTADYSQEIIDQIESASQEKTAESDPEDEGDPMLGDAIDVIMDTGQASASMLQRRLKLGYARAARIIDQMEARGIIGPFDGSRPRQILISRTDWQEMKLRYGARS